MTAPDMHFAQLAKVSAHLVAIIDTKTMRVLGFDIWGPQHPDPFARGELGKDRMVAVVMSVAEMTYRAAFDAIVGSIYDARANPGWLPVVQSLQERGKI